MQGQVVFTGGFLHRLNFEEVEMGRVPSERKLRLRLLVLHEAKGSLLGSDRGGSGQARELFEGNLGCSLGQLKSRIFVHFHLCSYS